MGLGREKQLIFAIDTDNRSEFDTIVSEVCPIDKNIAVKVGNVPMMNFGIGYITKKIGEHGNKIVWDAKASYDSGIDDDIYVAKMHLHKATDNNIDAFIINDTDPRMVSILATEAEGTGTDIIAVAEMSYKGADVFPINELYEYLAREAITNGAKGLVCPATKPKRIRKYREIIDETNPGVYIISPGAGTQSGIYNFENALINGADKPIVGRYITEAENRIWRAKKCLRIIDSYK